DKIGRGPSRAARATMPNRRSGSLSERERRNSNARLRRLTSRPRSFACHFVLKPKGGVQVFSGKLGIASKQALLRLSCRQKFKDNLDWDTRADENRTTSRAVGIDLDSARHGETPAWNTSQL